MNIVFNRGNSLFHRIDPISKFIYVVCIALVSIVNQDLLIQVVFVCIAGFIALFLSGTSVKTYWTFGKVILPFVLVLSCIYPFMYQGHLTGSEAIAIHTPIRDLSYAAIAFGVMLGLRFITFAFAGLMYAFTTHPDDIIQSASRKGIPYRIVHAVVIGLVFLPIFVGYAQEILIAQKIRNIGSSTNRIKKWFVSVRHVAFAMLVLGLKKSQIIATTLEIKGYGASPKKTFLHHLDEPLYGKIIAYACIALTIGFTSMQIHSFLQTTTFFWGR